MSCLVVGNHTQGLGIVRAIGRSGIPVHVLYDKHICLSRFSRYTTKFHLAPKRSLSSLYFSDHHEAVLDKMLSIVPHGERWALFGVSEDITHFFYTHQEHLKTKFHLPENDILQIIDKYRYAMATEEAGVPSPKTYLLSEMTDAMTQSNTFVAKGRIGNKFRRISNIKGITISNPRDLQRIRNYIKDKLHEDEVIIQKVIDSQFNVQSSCGLAVKGQLFSSFMYEKIRQSPDRFGTGTFNRSIYSDEMLSSTKKIISHLNYTGIFEIEYLPDEQGRLISIEMNPRTWKCIDLAVACGQNLCLQFYNYTKYNTTPEKLTGHSLNQYWAHFLADAVFMLKHGKLNFGYKKGMSFCDYDPDDMKPFIAEISLIPLIALGV